MCIFGASFMTICLAYRYTKGCSKHNSNHITKARALFSAGKVTNESWVGFPSKLLTGLIIGNLKSSRNKLGINGIQSVSKPSSG